MSGALSLAPLAMPTRPSLRISFGAGDVQLAEDGDQIACSFAAQAPKAKPVTAPPSGKAAAAAAARAGVRDAGGCCKPPAGRRCARSKKEGEIDAAAPLLALAIESSR